LSFISAKQAPEIQYLIDELPPSKDTADQTNPSGAEHLISVPPEALAGSQEAPVAPEYLYEIEYAPAIFARVSKKRSITFFMMNSS
jgi:hypothetical protein